MRIKIILADDHQIIRQGLRTLLEKESDLEVVGEAEDGRSVVRLIRDTAVDVVVMDVAMPDLNGIEATRKITSESPGSGSSRSPGTPTGGLSSTC